MKSYFLNNKTVIILFLLVTTALISSCDKKEKQQEYFSTITIKTYDDLLKYSHLIFSATLTSREKELVDGYQMLVYKIANMANDIRSEKYSTSQFNGILTQYERVCDIQEVLVEECDQTQDGGTTNCREEWMEIDPCPFEDEHYLPPLDLPVLVFASFANEGHAEILMVFRIENDEADLTVLGGPVLSLSNLAEVAEDPRFKKPTTSATR